MKVRHGFVSNSSSYSFVLVVGVCDHVAALNGLNAEDQRLMLKTLHGIKPQKIGDGEVIIITGGDYEEGWVRGDLQAHEITNEGDWDAAEQAKEFWDHYIALLPEDRIHYKWEDG